jgi:hypothetical protein
MNTDTPPSTPRAVIETLGAYRTFGVSTPLLVAVVADRADAGLTTVRATIQHLEQTGDIYSPDDGATWKVVR